MDFSTTLPGTPLFDPQLDLVAAARTELLALQKAGFDAVMFGNKKDRPYEFDVDTVSTATMAAIIGQLNSDISIPFGVNMSWDHIASVTLGVATDADFVREIFTGMYAFAMGSIESITPILAIVFIVLPQAIRIAQLTGDKYAN